MLSQNTKNEFSSFLSMKKRDPQMEMSKIRGRTGMALKKLN
jgi:hypothetical protein